MTSLLIYRQGRFQSADESARVIPTTPSNTWMAIYTGPEDNETRIGYVNTTTTPGSRSGDSGVQYTLTLRLDTRLFGQRTELDLAGASWVSAEHGLRDFQFRVHSGGAHAISVTGKVEDERLNLELETAGEVIPLSFPVSSDLLLRGGFGTTTLNLPAMEIGDTVAVDAFDPITMTKGTAYLTCLDTETITVHGEPVLTKIVETDIGGVKSTAWVAPDGEVLRVDSPLGFRLRVVDRAEALAELDTSQGSEALLDTLAVRPETLKPFRGAQRMRFQVSGLPRGLAPVIDERQTESGAGNVEIHTPETPTAAGTPLDQAAAYLAGDPLVQTTHPEIVSKANELVKDTQGDWENAQAIADWVFETVEKRSVLSFPSAIDVLRTLEGDCNEHTVLYAALSRAAGIPTKIAVGLVWSESLDGFYYHAWPEVYAGEWIPIDPTLGQPIADATHIKLLEGGIEEWPRLAPFLGQIEIDVLEVE